MKCVLDFFSSEATLLFQMSVRPSDTDWGNVIFSAPIQDRQFRELISSTFYIFQPTFICPIIEMLNRFLDFQGFCNFSTPFSD